MCARRSSAGVPPGSRNYCAAGRRRFAESPDRDRNKGLRIFGTASGRPDNAGSHSRDGAVRIARAAARPYPSAVRAAVRPSAPRHGVLEKRAGRNAR